jgi:WD40 repeat protein
MAVSGHLDGGIRFWDTRCNTSSSSSSTTKPLESILPTSSRECITSVMFNSSGTQVISCSRDMWTLMDLRNVKNNLSTIATVGHPKVKSSKSTSSSALLFSTTASFSPDGRYVVVGSNTTGKVFIWDVCNLNDNDDTKPQTELNSHTYGVEGVAWGRGGSSCQQLASVDKGGNLILWS